MNFVLQENTITECSKMELILKRLMYTVIIGRGTNCFEGGKSALIYRHGCSGKVAF